MVNICVLYGGPSVEHEVSCMSATTIYRALHDQHVEPTLIGIDKDGGWFYQPRAALHHDTLLITRDEAQRVSIEPGIGLRVGATPLKIDVAFPMLHGEFGEDGGIQAILTQCGIAYVGSKQMASAIGMNKLLSKMCWDAHNLPIVEYCSAFIELRDDTQTHRQRHAVIPTELTEFIDTHGYPLFIKPCVGGSSLGVHKVNHAAQLDDALQDAARYDRHILCERAIVGRELECAVIHTAEGRVLASAIGEIETEHGFYDYRKKYLHTAQATLITPAQIDADLQSRIQCTAEQAYTTIGCRDLARVDLLAEDSGRYYLNEINTLPGFTAQSMFPILWSISGYSLGDLLDLFIERATKRGN